MLLPAALHLQARAILEIAMLGRQIQELLNLQSLHRSYDVSDLQKVSNLILSSSDTRLISSGAADILMKSADSLKRSIEAVSGSIASCFAAIEELSHSIKQHAEKNGAIAAELRRKPHCQELSIEKHLLSRIQEELAKRGQAIACSRRMACVFNRPSNRRFAAVVDILKSSAAAELEVLAASAGSMGHQTEPVTTLASEHHEAVIAALREEMQVLKRGMQAMANQFHQLQQHSTLQQHPLPRSNNYLMATRAHIVPIEGKNTPESEVGGDGEAKPTSKQQQDDGFPRAQPYVNLRIRESPLLEFKENFDVDHTRDRALRGDAAPSTTSSQPRQSSPINHLNLNSKQTKMKSLSKSVKSNEKKALTPDFCFPTKDPFDPAVMSGSDGGDGKALNHLKDYCDDEEKEIDATQSLGDQDDVDKQEEVAEVPKTQQTMSQHEPQAVKDQADDQRGEEATPSVVQKQQGTNSDGVLRTAVGIARDPRSLPMAGPLRPIKGWWSSQKDSTSPGSGENNGNSKEDAYVDDCLMPEAKRVRREEEESPPNAHRPTYQPFHRQGTQQSGGVFTPATYALKLSQKSLAGRSVSAPPSSVRVAGAAKGATPMFVSLDPTLDRAEHGITPPPPCGTGVSVYKRDMT